MDKDYKCSVCGKFGVKLWRQYNRITVEVVCTSCLEKESREKYDGVSHSFNWHVPAIPVPCEKDTYWGFTSVPENQVEWWKELPVEPHQRYRLCYWRERDAITDLLGYENGHTLMMDDRELSSLMLKIVEAGYQVMLMKTESTGQADLINISIDCYRFKQR